MRSDIPIKRRITASSLKCIHVLVGVTGVRGVPDGVGAGAWVVVGLKGLLDLGVGDGVGVEVGAIVEEGDGVGVDVGTVVGVGVGVGVGRGSSRPGEGVALSIKSLAWFVSIPEGWRSRECPSGTSWQGGDITVLMAGR
jgi:hypothetical protein